MEAEAFFQILWFPYNHLTLKATVDIENCLDEYENSDVDIVITVTDAHSPYFNMVKIQEDGTVT